MTVPLPIETERLLIRPFDAEVDVEAAVSFYCDAEVMRYVTGGPLSDAEAVRGVLEKYVRAQQEYGFSSWAVAERETGGVIGDVGFGIFERTNEIELGYTLAHEFWGRGYASEAAASCLSAGLAHLDVPRLITVVDAENQASMRVAERIGMARVQTIAVHHRPHLVFEAQGLRRAASHDPRLTGSPA